jgi:hypothetical protein
LVGGVRSISSDRRAHALPMQCALRLAFGQDIRSNVWSLVKMEETERSDLQPGRTLGRASIGL